MTFEMYIGITGVIICCTISIVSMLWSINKSLRILIDFHSINILKDSFKEGSCGNSRGEDKRES